MSDDWEYFDGEYGIKRTKAAFFDGYNVYRKVGEGVYRKINPVFNFFKSYEAAKAFLDKYMPDQVPI